MSFRCMRGPAGRPPGSPTNGANADFRHALEDLAYVLQVKGE
ncbi:MULTISPECIES: hypothetical protein [unclassified Streptomyces]|nr:MULTISPECIES: hypothetical protein [unclassified Streptomyces]WSF89121.1 hypothetical protein OIE70_42150 [Streptomyces sp. NBC_01744]WSC34710.1 hypothetical protein OHA08_03725 [Streptomyces sp. NBC_01763]WSC43117.1 hypothetical protein OIE61_03580 [Streptomyces sp. NBC_01762]WSC58021.1 hypothetical protein OG808_40605 [Streptomyces sp. NBC_01761]WSD22654.1 hypothetical protein OHA26_03640 [Streptomyces sp. NBC_01751]